MSSTISDVSMMIDGESHPGPRQPPQAVELDPQRVQECLQAGTPLKELLDYNDQVWETMYDFGYRNFINGQFELAEYWWTFTALFDSGRDRNWIALGVACKRQGKHEQALNAFSLAVHHGSTNPWAPLHAAECHFQLGRLFHAGEALKDAERWAPHSDDRDQILRRIAMLRKGIQKLEDKQTATNDTPRG